MLMVNQWLVEAMGDIPDLGRSGRCSRLGEG